MKKIIKLISSIITLLLIALIVVVVIFFVKIHDNTNNTIEELKTKDIDFLEILSRQSAEAFDNNDDVRFNLNEYCLNEIMYSATKNLSFLGINVLGAYVEFDEENAIKLELPISLYGFNSCLKGNVLIAEDNGDFLIQIKDASIGNLSVTSIYYKLLFLTRINNEQIEENLKNSGIYIDLDFKNLSFKMTKEDILNTLSSKIEKEELGIIPSIADLCLNNKELIEFNLGKEKNLGFTVHLKDLKYQETDGVIPYEIDMPLVKNNVEGVSDVNYKNVSALYNYYISGYKSITDDEKLIIDELNLSKTNSPIRNKLNKEMGNIVLNQEPSHLDFMSNFGTIMKVSESDFNDVFASSDFIGKTYAFYRENDSAFITLEDLYCDINNDEFILKLIMNLDGVRVIIKTTLESSRSNSLVMNGKSTEISIGNIKLTEKIHKDIIKYLDILLKDETWINMNYETLDVSIDFKEIFINSDLIKKLVELNTKYTTELSLVGDNSFGELRIKFSLI